MQKEEVSKYIRENDIKFIRLQFTDILGTAKNVSIPVEQLDKALNSELTFDGSSIKGFVRIEESDMLLHPDPNTLKILPWKPRGGEARMICDVLNNDGTPFMGCPRNNLKRVIAEAKNLGYTMNVGPEVEFFLFPLDAESKPVLKTREKASYFDLSPVDQGEDARRDMVVTLQEIGFYVETSHHEVAPGQHEIGFKYGDALSMADKVVTFKDVIRNIAYRHNLQASFMPKPIPDEAGSGMHVNLSLFQDNNNVFYNPSTPDQLSEVAYQFIAGLLKHAPALCAITNPIVNSYKRLVPDYEAPVYIAWSVCNRSPLIRVPAARKSSTRIELRSPDPSCNPYTTFAAILAAGLDGIKNRLTPPEPANRNIYSMSAEERKKSGITMLPDSLKEALKLLDEDQVVKEALGDHLFSSFMTAKNLEWNEYRIQIHPWEIEKYLI